MKFVILLEIFIILGSWGVLFVFAKCNMKADTMALVSYADLEKKKKKKTFTYIACFLCLCEIFF